MSEHAYSSEAYEALLISAIIFYIRPFSGNEKKGSPSPSESRVPNTVLASLDTNELRLHRHLKTLRNKAIAHAEWRYHPTGVTDTLVIQAMPFSIWKCFRGTDDITNFSNLVHKVHREIQNAQANMLHELP
ncbi:hypothetical protein [Geothrix fuzhouensis]|uniref:hypothetical protein n=1 Tax=Geothrix fuzhouensis TaxID=2966451 RepID=UPI002148ABBF|nr:hypothetical protein [Geothrix fuzhouensis]